MDKSLSGQDQYTILMGTSIPAVDRNIKLLGEIIAKRKEMHDEDPEIVDTLSRSKALLEEFPGWKEIDALKAGIYAKFEANHVSRSFPLNFLPAGCLDPELFSVSLVEKTDEWKGFPEFEKLMRRGCQNAADHSLVDTWVAEMKGKTRDHFGRTERADKLAKLLEQISEPRTLITDLYIIDRYPELLQSNYETFEYVPSGEA